MSVERLKEYSELEKEVRNNSRHFLKIPLFMHSGVLHRFICIDVCVYSVCVCVFASVCVFVICVFN